MSAAIKPAALLAGLVAVGLSAWPAAPAREIFPSDLGPRTLGGAGGMPEGLRGGFSLALVRCGTCHTPARALHHRYAEPDGKNLPDKEAAVSSLKADHPEFFREPWVWQVEADIWKRCVDRMAAKSSSGIGEGDARAIHAFLVWDSDRRKLGKAAGAWKALRESLLRRFKARYPDRWRKLEALDAL
ncbi:MAG: hypothetical protein HY748_05310 [Elusimicrobia bacterium]|nr:hypothetical protein [Elusimicrobiota bacterium]